MWKYSVLLILIAPFVAFSDDCNSVVIGDIDGDCIVNFVDFALLVSNWLGTPDSNSYLPPDTNSVSSVGGAVNGFYPHQARTYNSIYNPSNVVFQDLCDDVGVWHRWTWQTDTLSLHIDDANEQFSQTYGKTLKIRHHGAGSAVVYRDLNVNLTKSYCKFSYYIPIQSTCPAEIAFVVKTQNGGGAQILYLPGTAGYHTMEFSLGGLIRINSIPADFNNVSQFMIYSKYSMPGTVIYIDSIQWLKNYSTPRVILSFDNGCVSPYNNARPLLNAHGMKAVFYVNHIFSDPYDTNVPSSPNYMTPSQILTLQQEGHLVGNHSWTHRLWQANPKPLYWEMLQEIEANRDWLDKIGIGASKDYYCQPSGASLLAGRSASEKAELLKFMIQQNHHVRMTTWSAYTDGLACLTSSGKQNGTFPNCGFRSLGYAHPLSSRTPGHKDTFDKTPEWGYLNGKQLIDLAVQNNDLVSLYWHDIKTDDSGDMNVTEFAALLDYIQACGCEVVTWGDVSSEN